MEIKRCLRCGEDWCYRGSGRPVRCGKCKSPYWDKGKNAGDIHKQLRSAGIAVSSRNEDGRELPVRSGPGQPTSRVAENPEWGNAGNNLSRTCKSCEGSLVATKGLWVCLDVSCGRYGQVQGSEGDDVDF